MVEWSCWQSHPAPTSTELQLPPGILKLFQHLRTSSVVGRHFSFPTNDNIIKVGRGCSIIRKAIRPVLPYPTFVASTRAAHANSFREIDWLKKHYYNQWIPWPGGMQGTAVGETSWVSGGIHSWLKHMAGSIGGISHPEFCDKWLDVRAIPASSGWDCWLLFSWGRPVTCGLALH